MLETKKKKKTLLFLQGVNRASPTVHPFVKGHGDLVCCNNDENADRQ